MYKYLPRANLTKPQFLVSHHFRQTDLRLTKPICSVVNLFRKPSSAATQLNKLQIHDYLRRPALMPATRDEAQLICDKYN